MFKILVHEFLFVSLWASLWGACFLNTLEDDDCESSDIDQIATAYKLGSGVIKACAIVTFITTLLKIPLHLEMFAHVLLRKIKYSKQKTCTERSRMSL